MIFFRFTSLNERPAITNVRLAAAADPDNPTATPTDPKEALKKTAQNLLAHIPGEASGLYLMAVDAMPDPLSKSSLAIVFTLSFTILVLVRWMAGASKGIMLTSIGAFMIWMLVLDKGLLHTLFPNLLQDPLGLVVAVFYSTAITILANAGKLK
ncbi:MAG: hypothetical protein SF097_20205 [Acidobacteriota bacterium]|nr:hypothetical protein [Acidobacteriota bacterium]